MKVLIADDHALFRDALGQMIENLNDSATIIQAANYAQALKILEHENTFDLVVADPQMQDLPSWEQGINNIKNAAGNARMVIISAAENPHSIKNALSNGVCGYISKRSESKILHNALKLIMEGGTYVPPAIIRKNSELGGKDSKVLTNRQNQVLKLVAQGMSNKQIAYEIGVSEATVKLHINALLRSIGANNRTQAVITAQKMGII
ncbi:MAG: response regulator transcription factor [Alphaproteobacteria bacterium]|nr:response regulator transcription factor [Alphaproteobacteria bacterium]